jgi:toxin ParE1/3/4
MSGRIRRSIAAERDLDRHAAYIQKDHPSAAIRFLDAARREFEFLAGNPELGERCRFRNPKAADVRMWLIHGFKNYVIFYRPTENGVEIVRVLHAAQDWEGIIESESAS